MTVRNLAVAAVFAVGAMTAQAANATIFVVDALANSSSGGTGLSTLSVTAGSQLNINVAVTDLWNAGALPRWSNADGLVGNLFATGSDDSGQTIGTQIGANFGIYSQFGLNAPYGTLIGEIAGNYFIIGTSYSAPAVASGTLKLYYFDSNFADNSGAISADVSAVPEASTWAMLIAGFGLVGAAARRRKVAGASA